MENKTFDINKIMEMLPHRYPFLLIDRIISAEKDEFVEGIKNVTINEPFFQGHFPQRPIMPGVLIIECMAQTAGALVLSSLGENSENKLVYFMSIEEARFRKPVEPGDQIKIKAEKIQNRRNVWKFAARATVENKLAAEAKFSAMIIEGTSNG